MAEVEKRLIYFEDEEHLVRRLGAALVVRWADFPTELRSRIIDTAENVLDAETDDDLDRHLRLFIAEHAQKRGQDGSSDKES